MADAFLMGQSGSSAISSNSIPGSDTISGVLQATGTKGQPCYIDRSITAITKLGNPSTLPEGRGYSCCFSPDGVYLAFGAQSPYLTIYKRSGDTFTKLANPATLPQGWVQRCEFSPDGIYLACAHRYHPYLTFYKRSGDTFTKLANPATLPPDTSEGCSWSGDGNYLAVASPYSSPAIVIYKRSGDTFTALANPLNLSPWVNFVDCAFSSDGVYLTVVGKISQAVSYINVVDVYKRSGDTFTKLGIATQLEVNAESCKFCKSNNRFLVTSDIDNHPPTTYIYKCDGDFVGIAGAFSASDLYRYATWSNDGSHLVVCGSGYSSPYFQIFKDGDTPIKLSSPVPTALPDSAFTHGCAWSPDGTYLVLAHDVSPYISIYKMTYTNKIYLSTDKDNVSFNYGAGILNANGTSGATVNVTRIFK